MDDGQWTTDNSQQTTSGTPMVGGQSSIVKFFAHLFSYIFHPIFIPLYVYYFLAFVHPTYFSGFSVSGKVRVLISFALNTVFFPAITVFLLKGLGFIESIYLRTQKDRIIPYISSMIFFFWTQYMLREQNFIP